MIDLHCHILPGVDDGSASEEESCQMARIAVECGVTELAATPHCNVPEQFENYASPGLAGRLERLQSRLDREKIPLRLHAGMEVYGTPALPQLLRRKKLLTLGGSRYLLIEFGFGESARLVEWMLEAVEDFGLTPVVAHPERYYFIQDDPLQLLCWAEKGRVLQVNKGSFFGMFGRRAARTAHWCLREGCLHLIASDAHSPYRRTTRLSDIYDYVSDVASLEIADFLLQDNPSALLEDRPVAPVLEKF